MRDSLDEAKKLKDKYWNYANRKYFDINKVIEFLEKMKKKVDNEEDIIMIDYLLHQMTYNNYKFEYENSRNQWW